MNDRLPATEAPQFGALRGPFRNAHAAANTGMTAATAGHVHSRRDRARWQRRRSAGLYGVALVLGLLAGLDSASDERVGRLVHPAPLAAAPAAHPADIVDPLAPMRAGSRIVWLPGGGSANCSWNVVAQNVGHEPTKATLIGWGNPGLCPPQAADPFTIECSGVIPPGGSWTFAGPQLPDEAHSMVLASFSTQTLYALGVDLGFNDIAADYLCETLFFLRVGDHLNDYWRFHQAFLSGEAYAGVPMERAAGAPLAATLHRTCTLPGGDAPVRRGSVAGVPATDAGLDVASAERSYRYAVPLAVASPVTPTGTTFYIQNAGALCASVDVVFRPTPQDGQTTDTEPCVIHRSTLAFGESWRADLGSCAKDGVLTGAIEVEGTAPLAIWAERMVNEGLHTVRAVPAGIASGMSPWPDEATTSLVAPIVLRGIDRWSSRIHVQNLDEHRAAEVQLTGLSRGGRTTLTASLRVPARQVRRFDLDALTDGPSMWIGSMRIESSAADWADGAAPSIAASVVAWRNEFGDAASDAFAYTAASVRTTATRATDAGGLLALPQLGRATDLSHELAVMNAARTPGHTNAAVLLFDTNGLLDVVCVRLDRGATEFVDLANWGFIAPGFRGSAVISASTWNHRDASAGADAPNPVSLAAVMLRRPNPAEDPTTDPALGLGSHAALAVAIPDSADARFLPVPASGFDLCGRRLVFQPPTPWPPIATRTPAATATATATAIASRDPVGQAFLPWARR